MLAYFLLVKIGNSGYRECMLNVRPLEKKGHEAIAKGFYVYSFYNVGTYLVDKLEYPLHTELSNPIFWMRAVNVS
jgi:hypothetical protein